MKIQFLTIGKPKLAYAKLGVEEYLGRLQRLHTVRITQLADKFAYDASKILENTPGTYVVVLEITAEALSSTQLAQFLEKRELEAREVSFVIGGPNGLPKEVIDKADFKWSIGRHTLPHDLAMVVVLEALYRATTINAGTPYHK